MGLVAIFLLVCMFDLSAVAQGWIKEPTNDNPQQWTISGEADLVPGDFIDPQSGVPICKDRREETSLRFSDLLGQAVNAKIFDSLKSFRTSGGFLSGSVIDTLQTEVAKFNEGVAGEESKKDAAKTGKDFSLLLNQLGTSRRYAGCGTIALILPWGTMKVGTPKYVAAEDAQNDTLKYKQCDDAGKDGMAMCSIGKIGVSMYRDRYSLAYIFVIKNWSGDRTRHVRVSMPFTPAQGYIPPEDNHSRENSTPRSNNAEGH
jgi:hypothetical protein